jgi:uncharacterized protein involved in type VI secretion and phage assembly
MEEILAELVEQVRNRYYGKYRGIVVDKADPQQVGRVQVRVPAVLGEGVALWALPCLPHGGLSGEGLFTVPEVGAQVWVEFEAGNLEYPIWTGTFWQARGDAPEDVQQDDGPSTRLLATAAGNKLIFEDRDGEESITLRHPSEASIEMNPEGGIVLTDSAGATLTLDAEGSQVLLEDSNGNRLTMSATGTTVEDANGNKIEMAASGITVEGTTVVVQGQQVLLGGQGGEPLIKGTSFLSLFATHIHTVAPIVGGPTSPPIPQGEFSSLSTTVMST